MLRVDLRRRGGLAAGSGAWPGAVLSRTHAPLLAQGGLRPGLDQIPVALAHRQDPTAGRDGAPVRLGSGRPPKQTARSGSNASPLPLGPKLQHQPSRQVGPSFRRLACPSPCSLGGLVGQPRTGRCLRGNRHGSRCHHDAWRIERSNLVGERLHLCQSFLPSFPGTSSLSWN